MPPSQDTPAQPPVGRALLAALFVMILIVLAPLAWRSASPVTPEITWRMNPNTATAGELQLLPGIGPALAARIIADRANGPYNSSADLQRVSGIGPIISSRIAPSLSYHASDAPPEIPR